jgi:hypothetical protein
MVYELVVVKKKIRNQKNITKPNRDNRRSFSTEPVNFSLRDGGNEPPIAFGLHRADCVGLGLESIHPFFL